MGAFTKGTGGKTAKGVYPTPVADRKGNMKGKVKNIQPRQVTVQGK